MSRVRAVAVLLLCVSSELSANRPCVANPVPDHVAEAFKELVWLTAALDSCPDPAGLARSFGAFGLNLLSRNELAAIDAHFDVFAPILVESQRPCNHLSYDIQALFRRHANPTQRVAMIEALRDWLVSPIESAPWSMIAGPPKRVTLEIERARVTAAEMLSAWMDVDSAPLIERILKPDTLDSDLQWSLERARQRLFDPTARSFVVVQANGSIRLYESTRNIRRTVVKSGNLDSHDESHLVPPADVEKLWRMLPASRVIERGLSSWGNYCVIIEFRDGVRAGLSPTGNGEVVYEDNTSLDWRWRVTFRDDRLYSYVMALIQNGFGGETE